MNKTFKKNFGVKLKEAKLLGEGQFGKVFLVNFKNQQRAVKIVRKKSLKGMEEKIMMKNEIKIHLKVKNPHIVEMVEHIQDKRYHYLVLENMEGGELFKRIVEKNSFSERKAAIVIRNVAQALEYMHGLKYVHRDMKPENLLLSNKESDTDVKIADFGFATSCSENLYSGVGTILYVAPEVLLGNPYRSEVDIWSLGVIMFVLLGGYSPFNAPTDDEIRDQIIDAKLVFPEDAWGKISDSAKDLILKMCEKDQKKRFTATEVLKHEWVVNAEKHKDEDIENIGQKLREFQAKQTLKKAFHGMKLINKLNTLATLTQQRSSIGSDSVPGPGNSFQFSKTMEVDLPLLEKKDKTKAADKEV